MNRRRRVPTSGTFQVRLAFRPHDPERNGQGDCEAGVTGIRPGNIPRVSQLMALAIKMERMVQHGEVRDYAELARLGHITRARMTQIMNLLSLAPDIQEAILFLPRTTKGRDPITEGKLRPIAAVAKWEIQREMWRNTISNRVEP